MAFESSFPVLFLSMKTLVSQSGKSERFSFALCITSKGVFPLGACVDVLFFNQTAWWIVSGQRFFGSSAVISMAHTCSSNVRFSCSTTPFSSGVSCTVKVLMVPFPLRCLVNSFDRYSPPLSDCSTLICLPYCVFNHASYSLYLLNMFNFLLIQ